MSFPKYPKYKASGVNELGDLPEHWDIKPLKHFAGIDSCGCYGVDAEAGEYVLPVATTAQIDSDGRFIVPDMPMRGFSPAEIQRYGCGDGDILVVKSSGSATNIISGKAGLVTKDTPPFVFSNFLMRIRPTNSAANPRFIYSVLRSHLTRQRVEQMCSTTTYPNLKISEYTSAPLPLPPLAEQSIIAAFLDRETAKIDGLIAEQRRLMELLKEKRQAVVSHAVTKGLDPNAKMKPSGVEWLGDVPDGWEVKPMRMIANVVRGASPRPAGDPRYFGGEEVPWVTVAEITKDGAVYLTETESFLTKEGAAHSNLFRSGTLIYSNSGATLGVPKILRIDACANDGVVAFLNLRSEVQPEFLFHYLASITDCIREKVKQGSGQPNLNTDIVKNLRFGLPPLDEQALIVNRITELAEQFGTLTAEAQRAIDLLQERRTALISAAVTGQIDVRKINNSQGV